MSIDCVSSRIMELHRDELLDTCVGLRRKALESSTRAKMQPPRMASYLFAHLQGLPMPEHTHWSDGPGQAVRKIHDFYGWKAWGAAQSGGLCAGTL